MARIKLGSLVTDVRGSVKEVVYSIWKTGVHYIRSKAGIISNPQSTLQALIRNLMTLASKQWYDTLTAQQRANWNEFAQGLEPQEGGGGGILNIIPQNRGIMSGMNAYCMCYTMVTRMAIVLPVGFDDAPLGATPPSAITSFSGVWTDPTVDLSWVDPTTVESDSVIRVWTRSHENMCHVQLAGGPGLLALGVVLGAFRGANGAPINYVDAPGHYLFQADVIQPNGLKSPPSATIEVIVT